MHIRSRLAGVGFAVVLALAGAAMPADARLPAGSYFAVPGTSSPPGAPVTRRVDVRLTATGPMLRITFDCGAPAPCTTPEVPAVMFRGPYPEQYVNAAPLGPSAPRTYFVFVYYPAAPCLGPGPYLPGAANPWLAVWTGGAPDSIANCTNKGLNPPFKPNAPDLRNTPPRFQLPPMRIFPRLTPNPPGPLPGRKPG